VPLVAAPDGTSDPQPWSTRPGDEPAVPTRDAEHADDLTVQQQNAEGVDRRGRAAGDVPVAAPPGSDAESGYATESTQGAAQPGPTQEERS
jgi:hypothetical protein